MSMIGKKLAFYERHGNFLLSRDLWDALINHSPAGTVGKQRSASKHDVSGLGTYKL